MRIRSVTLALAFSLLGEFHYVAAQTGPPGSYKLGTFKQNGRMFLGVVLEDARVVDLAKANAAYESGNASARKLTMPMEMIELINRYESELKPRLSAIAGDVSRAASAPAYVYALTSLETLPPVRPSLSFVSRARYTSPIPPAPMGATIS